jgi:hypothetical protein
MSLRRWDEVHKLLPPLVDFINQAMKKEWSPGTARDIRIMANGAIQPAVPPPTVEAPPPEPFELDKMLSTEHLGLNEIYFFLASEWDRLFAWCAFLETRDGAYELYDPLVLTLRRGLHKILSGS